MGVTCQMIMIKHACVMSHTYQCVAVRHVDFFCMTNVRSFSGRQQQSCTQDIQGSSHSTYAAGMHDQSTQDFQHLMSNVLKWLTQEELPQQLQRVLCPVRKSMSKAMDADAT